MTKTKNNAMTPKRFQNMKSNATVATAERKIAEEYGLPEGSVRLIRPGGKEANRNKTIGALRREWDSENV